MRTDFCSTFWIGSANSFGFGFVETRFDTTTIPILANIETQRSGIKFANV